MESVEYLVLCLAMRIEVMIADITRGVRFCARHCYMCIHSFTHHSHPSGGPLPRAYLADGEGDAEKWSWDLNSGSKAHALTTCYIAPVIKDVALGVFSTQADLENW